MTDLQNVNEAKAKKNLMTVSLFAIVMLFAGFTSAYLVSSASQYWVVFDLPPAFVISTVIIVLSSITMYAAQRAIKQGNLSLFRMALVATLLFGIGFSVTQFQGWSQLVEGGNTLTGNPIKAVKGTYGVDFVVMKKGVVMEYVNGEYYHPDDVRHTRPETESIIEKANTRSSYIYVFTMVHFLHLTGGLIALLVIAYKASGNQYTPENHAGVSMGATYWHFLSGLWIYLYLFLYLFH